MSERNATEEAAPRAPVVGRSWIRRYFKETPINLGNFVTWRGLALLCIAGLLCTPAWADDLQLSVTREKGGVVLIDAELLVPIPLGIAWEVLTDYPHMTEYIAGLTESRVVSGPDEPLRVLQRGKVTLGWFSHDYEVEREVSLIPDAEIRSRVVRGNMKRFDTTMTVVAEGAATRIRYHSESVPGFWIPPLIGTTLMRRQITEHLAALRTEMQRRHAARSHPPAGSGG